MRGLKQVDILRKNNCMDRRKAKATVKIKSNPYERKTEHLSYKESASVREEIQV